MYAPIKHMRFNWETESHSFIFDTGGSKIEALDSIGDIIGSLQDLYRHIIIEEDGDDIPTLFKIHGTARTTQVEVKYG